MIAHKIAAAFILAALTVLFVGYVAVAALALDPAAAAMTIAIVASVSAAMAIALGLALAAGIAKPLARLRDACDDIGKGHIDLGVCAGRADEIGELSDAFRSMARNLKAVMHRERDLAMRIAEAEVIQLKALELGKAYDDLKVAQEKLVRNERLATIGRMAATVAHEIRNPLGVIKNVAYYLRMPGPARSEGEIGENLAILCREVDNADRIIRDLLEYSRTRNPVLNPEDVNAIVREALTRAKPPAGVEVITELGARLPQTLTDAWQLQEIFQNIITNACEAMAGRGRLTIRTAADAGMIDASFADTGPGMSPASAAKAFEPFFTTKEGGAGLGLAISLSLAEGLGGRIVVRSEEGKGTTFTVSVPVREE